MPSFNDVVSWISNLMRCFNMSITLYGYSFNLFQVFLFPAIIGLFAFAVRGMFDCVQSWYNNKFDK